MFRGLQHRRNKWVVHITTSMLILIFGHDVLIDYVHSVQKRALVGRWDCTEIMEGNMHYWVEMKWKTLLGYMPTVVRLAILVPSRFGKDKGAAMDSREMFSISTH